MTSGGRSREPGAAGRQSTGWPFPPEGCRARAGSRIRTAGSSGDLVLVESGGDDLDLAVGPGLGQWYQSLARCKELKER